MLRQTTVAASLHVLEVDQTAEETPLVAETLAGSVHGWVRVAQEHVWVGWAHNGEVGLEAQMVGRGWTCSQEDMGLKGLRGLRGSWGLCWVSLGEGSGFGKGHWAEELVEGARGNR